MSGRVIAVGSGKGGLGKTWLAITLAQALAAAGRRVLLFDADFGLANLDVQLGLAPARDLGDVIAGRAEARAVVIRHSAGFDLLPGRAGSGRLAGLAGPGLEALLALPRQLAAEWDEVVVDLGAGVEPPQRRLAAAADLLLVLASEEPTSLTDAYAVLKLHAQDAPAGAARLVVNLAASQAAGLHVHATLRAAMQRFLQRDLVLGGILRRDPKVPDAIRHQVPLLTRHPGSPAACDVTALAQALLRG